MQIATAQSEMLRSYVHGGPGTVVSGLVWLCAAFVESYSTVSTGFAVLFFGGMLIFPITQLIVQKGFGREPPSKENPGGLTVIETVFPMIGGLFAAWLLMPYRPEFVFPLAAVAVGAHYFGFRTTYGDMTFWVLGGLMCAIGTSAILWRFPPPEYFAFTIAVIELLFGGWLVRQDASHLSSANAQSGVPGE